MSDKAIRADAKLKNLPQETLDELWRFRNPDDEGEVITMEEILVELKNNFNIEVSLSTLSEFYKWLRFKRKMESGAALTKQVMEEMQKDPNMTMEQIQNAGQFVFMQTTMDQNDPKLFIKLAKLKLDQEKVKNVGRRIKLLEEKSARIDKAESDIAAIRGSKTLTEDQQRKAILDKMDEFFGLKKV